MQTTADIYLPMRNYDPMIRVLRELLTSLPALMGVIDPDDIKIALGEIAGIWPVAILPDLNATMEAAGIPAPAEVESPADARLPFTGSHALFAAGNRVTVKPPTLAEVREVFTPDPAVPLVALKR